jgi:chitin synthase
MDKSFFKSKPSVETETKLELCKSDLCAFPGLPGISLNPTQDDLDAWNTVIHSALQSVYSFGPDTPPYVWVGQDRRILIALSPPASQHYVLAQLKSLETRFTYARLLKSIKPACSYLWENPHILALTNHAYMQLRRLGTDQSIILQHKTIGVHNDLQLELILHQLCASSHGHTNDSKKVERFHQRIQSSLMLLQSFTWTHDMNYPELTYSKLGISWEVQFSERGKMIGWKIIPYAFQKSLLTRVTKQSNHSQRNFNIFYQLLFSGNEELLSELYLSDVIHSAGTSFSYLGKTTKPILGIDDQGRFESLQETFRHLGITKKSIHHIFQLLAAILHLGQLYFVPSTEYGGPCGIANGVTLEIIARLLEVDIQSLEQVLTLRTQLVGKDLVTQVLDAQGAEQARDQLAQVLYHVLVMWLIEAINKKVVNDDEMSNFIAILDFPHNPVPNSSTSSPNVTEEAGLEYCRAKIREFVHTRIWEYGNSELKSEGIKLPHSSNTKLASEIAQEGVDSQEKFLLASQQYDDALPGDFIHLIRGGHGHFGSKSGLFQQLFSEPMISLEAYAKNSSTVVRGASIVRRIPSVKRNRAIRTAPAKSLGHVSKVLVASNSEFPKDYERLENQLEALLASLESTETRVVYCIRPHTIGSTAFDAIAVNNQVKQLSLGSLVLHKSIFSSCDYPIRIPHAIFQLKYSPLVGASTTSADDMTDLVNQIRNIIGVSSETIRIGSTLTLLTNNAWVLLEAHLRKKEHDQRKSARRPNLEDQGSSLASRSSTSPFPSSKPRSFLNADAATEFSFDGDSVVSDDMTEVASEHGEFENKFGVLSDKGVPENANNNNNNRNLETQREVFDEIDLENSTVQEFELTRARRIWIAITWCLTWWVPTCCLIRCGSMKRDDIRMAWREKVAICILILIVCALQMFFIIGLGPLICPRQNIYTMEELAARNGFETDQFYVGIYGAVYDLDYFTQTNIHTKSMIKGFAGKDITAGFARYPTLYCEYARQFAPDAPPFRLPNAPGAFIAERHREFFEADPIRALRRIDVALRSPDAWRAMIGWNPEKIKQMSTNSTTNRRIYIIRDRVYDLQPYVDSGSRFLPSEIFSDLFLRPGISLDSNERFMKVWNSNRELRDCFNNLFVIGVVDARLSTRCMFTNYILLSFSVLLAAIIGVKFLAALQLGDNGNPEEYDRFVIMQVPCYTEGEDSLKRCIDSLATMTYDDKHKLLFLVCDGNIMGSGNDRPTPQIVLDILGVNLEEEVEALSFQSLGEGLKQHNMGKVYTGLYDIQGHLVPFMVVVKVGKPIEGSRPGNRGKRDSQMIMMRFLNKVYADLPMNPLELEMYHQIKNVIGVNPSFYEFCLMVDADTMVYPDSLTRLVSCMMHDTKISGLCGETLISNDKDTWATMIQVYEYYISHHLAKAFESLFGSVTCLPGCFSMYRLRAKAPILCSAAMVEDYGDVNVDTLHKKNLLHLGEDRYLTTLMLKHFPNMRTVFTPGAKCTTIVPERWEVLLSQRRRWINSTIHNLMELLNISQLCGFCCFSMRFVVFIDLIATVIQPAIVGFLGYLIYLVVMSNINPEKNLFPTISIILLAVIYGLQAVIFLLKREWQHIGWST